MSVSAQVHTVTVTPTLDTSAYAAGDRLGSIMTITAGNNGSHPVTLMDLKVLDKADQGAAFDIMFFNALPTVASADNAAISITATEMEKYLGHVSITADLYADFGPTKGAVKSLIGLGLKPANQDGIVYALCVSRGTPTYAASSLVLQFYFAMDRS